MEDSKLLHETLGAHQVEWFLRNKRAEWRDYREQVTAFELERYLPLL
jgi:glutamine synthetase